MNKFITTDVGGLPIQLDDFRFVDDSVRNALKGIMSAYGIEADESFILSGAGSTLNGPNFDIAAGYISLDGEILEVTAHSITTTLAGGEAHVWALKTAFDSAGLKTFESTFPFNTYQQRQAEVIVATISPPQLPMLAPTLFDKISDNFGIILQTKILAIGDWNMTASFFVQVAHGLSYEKIRTVEALIIQDGGAIRYPLTTLVGTGNEKAGGVASITSSNITLARADSTSPFTNGNFSDVSPALESRGWITVRHIA